MSAYATVLSEYSHEALLAECLRQHDRATTLEAEVARLKAETADAKTIESASLMSDHYGPGPTDYGRKVGMTEIGELRLTLAATQARLSEAERERDELREFLEPEAQCPYCCATEVCLSDCTYREDCVNSPLGLARYWERLEAVRDLLRRTRIAGRSE